MSASDLELIETLLRHTCFRAALEASARRCPKRRPAPARASVGDVDLGWTVEELFARFQQAPWPSLHQSREHLLAEALASGISSR